MRRDYGRVGAVCWGDAGMLWTVLISPLLVIGSERIRGRMKEPHSSLIASNYIETAISVVVTQVAMLHMVHNDQVRNPPFSFPRFNSSTLPTYGKKHKSDSDQTGNTKRRGRRHQKALLVASTPVITQRHFVRVIQLTPTGGFCAG